LVKTVGTGHFLVSAARLFGCGSFVCTTLACPKREPSTRPSTNSEAVKSVVDSLAAPDGLALRSNDNQTVIIHVGQELQITLGTVGPGDYTVPPKVSSAVLSFLSASYVGPYVPAGPRQTFRFKAVATGKAIILFEHTGWGRKVEDTVEVW
jgi:hypothetical protein